ncbi:hypothetical protein C3942_11775 [Solimonas fluminis]|uniref:DUF4345 domain-containing protein n=1 Tax=Solimonas fluminis TaxID=2086571 RepID=A0A2S5TEX0_9GAMM|nr:hypothetical protein [Solimonas fluminis]PPE73482.1 hypothetical protein C3942_11775 [Solimonas fluminis]
MRNPILAVLGLGLLANGLFMLLAPASWYPAVPGVSATGPYNPHFIRDIGAAYSVSGAGLLALLRWPQAWPAAIAGSAFQLLHALIHVFDALQGRVAAGHLLNDALLVVVPALAALALSWPRKAAPAARYA